MSNHHTQPFQQPKRRKIEYKNGPSQPCDRCVAMVSWSGLQSMKTQAGFRHYDKIYCKASAAGGCPLCMTIASNAASSWKTSEALRFVIPSWRKTLGIEDIIGFSIDPTAPINKSRFIVVLTLFTTEEDPAAGFIRSRPVVTDVLGPQALGAARSWVKECKFQHQRCYYAGPPVLPLRVIDVRPLDSSSLKLFVNTQGLAADYACLSYCWGGAQTFVNNRETFNQLQRGFSFESLPQSIKDAVETTRNLGLQYLWVDALCIIQDSTEDKQKEIERMGTIYKNATVTIAASVASAAADGFLHIERTQPKSYTFDILLPNGKVAMASVAARELCTTKNPLRQRGWAYQEFLLSPRVLSYSERELMWHCQTEQLQTVTRSSLNYVLAPDRLPPRIFNDDLRHGKSWTTDKQRIELWASVVGDYSSRYLTDPEDRLHALAGIAGELRALWDDDYLYGLWRRCLVRQLAWSSLREQDSRSKRAPSWSWASLDGAVEFKILTASYTKDLTRYPIGVNSVTKLTLSGKVRYMDEVPKAKIEYSRRDLSKFGISLASDRYFLLGRGKVGKRDIGVGLEMICDEEGVYRRIGYVEFADLSVWDHVQEQIIVLC